MVEVTNMVFFTDKKPFSSHATLVGEFDGFYKDFIVCIGQGKEVAMKGRTLPKA